MKTMNRQLIAKRWLHYVRVAKVCENCPSNQTCFFGSSNAFTKAAEALEFEWIAATRPSVNIRKEAGSIVAQHFL